MLFKRQKKSVCKMSVKYFATCFYMTPRFGQY